MPRRVIATKRHYEEDSSESESEPKRKKMALGDSIEDEDFLLVKSIDWLVKCLQGVYPGVNFIFSLHPSHIHCSTHFVALSIVLILRNYT